MQLLKKLGKFDFTTKNILEKIILINLVFITCIYLIKIKVNAFRLSEPIYFAIILSIGLVLIKFINIKKILLTISQFLKN